MKIYCNRQDKLSFDYYVGKPVWVKVTNKPPYDVAKQHFWWTQFLSKHVDRYGEFYLVHSIYTGLYPVDFSIQQQLRNTTDKLYVDSYMIAEPIECIDDSELEEILLLE